MFFKLSLECTKQERIFWFLFRGGILWEAGKYDSRNSVLHSFWQGWDAIIFALEWNSSLSSLVCEIYSYYMYYVVWRVIFFISPHLPDETKSESHQRYSNPHFTLKSENAVNVIFHSPHSIYRYYLNFIWLDTAAQRIAPLFEPPSSHRPQLHIAILSR